MANGVRIQLPKLYEVNRAGITRVLRPQAPAVPSTTVDQSAAFPDCQCVKCRPEGKADSSYRVLLTTSRSARLVWPGHRM